MTWYSSPVNRPHHCLALPLRYFQRPRLSCGVIEGLSSRKGFDSIGGETHFQDRPSSCRRTPSGHSTNDQWGASVRERQNSASPRRDECRKTKSKSETATAHPWRDQLPRSNVRMDAAIAGPAPVGPHRGAKPGCPDNRRSGEVPAAFRSRRPDRSGQPHPVLRR